MEDRWFGNEFQILGATDENDLEAAMVVLRGGTDIEKEEEERSANKIQLRQYDVTATSWVRS